MHPVLSVGAKPGVAFLCGCQDMASEEEMEAASSICCGCVLYRDLGSNGTAFSTTDNHSASPALLLNPSAGFVSFVNALMLDSSLLAVRLCVLPTAAALKVQITCRLSSEKLAAVCIQASLGRLFCAKGA